MSLLGFLCFLIVAAVCAWIGEYFVPGSIPGGFFVSAIVGIIGAWIGGSLFGNFGPQLAGVALLPAIIGSAIFVFCLAMLSRAFARA